MEKQPPQSYPPSNYPPPQPDGNHNNGPPGFQSGYPMPPPGQGYPPPQQGYPPPQQGYPPPQQGYPPPPQQGYPPPPQQGGYPPPQQGGYPPPQQGGYPAPGQPYAPPPQVYPPPNAAPTSHQPATIIIAPGQPTHTIFGPIQTLAYCKHCNQNVNTRTEATIGCMVWVMFLVFYLVSPCISCIPFCVTSWYDIHHYCPHCSRKLGEFTLM